MKGILKIIFLVMILVCVNAQQGITQTIAALSLARDYLAATSSGELVFFGGGYTGTGTTDQVDICNVTSGSWTTATLSIPRSDLAATSSGNLVFFAGGYNGNSNNPGYYDRVDIYNIRNQSWSIASLSQARSSLAATSVGSLVFFGGGWNSTFGPSNVVDIYNVTTNTWTTTTLSVARDYLTATSVANRYALFAGGYNGSLDSNAVDIYDSLNNNWMLATLSQPREHLVSTTLDNLAFFGGGIDDGPAVDIVDVFNSATQMWSLTAFSQPRFALAAAAIGDIVAFGGGTDLSNIYSNVDMYNVTSKTWFTLYLSQARFFLAATSSTNKIFFGGGWSSYGPSNIVDVFDIPPSLSPSPTPFSYPPISIFSLQTFPSPSITISTVVTQAPNFLNNITGQKLSTSQQSNLTPSSSNNNGALIGGVLAGIFGFLGLVMGTTFLIFILLKKRKQKKKEVSESSANILPLSPLSKSSVSYSQISFNEITVERKIGEGSYGEVFLGKWRNAYVALKFCAHKVNIDDFLREINILTNLPPHPNIVHLYGVALDGPQPVLVLEYYQKGSLDKVLFDSSVKLPLETKMHLIRGIAAGMLHLHKHNIIHRDLAARNILIAANGEPKISDFGMSRILQEKEVGQTISVIGPIRWMAPESISRGVYSKYSDVWTFGIVVWEIVAQCEPHININPIDVGVLIRDYHLTPQIPSGCPWLLQQLMQMCWKIQPEERPNFETICMMLSSSI